MELLLALFVVALIADGWMPLVVVAVYCPFPALLWAGFTPLEALATNKLQASFGSSTATLNYTRHGLVDVNGQKLTIALTFLGAVCGTLLVQQIDASVLEKAIPVLLMAFALYFYFRGKSAMWINSSPCHR